MPDPFCLATRHLHRLSPSYLLIYGRPLRFPFFATRGCSRQTAEQSIRFLVIFRNVAKGVQGVIAMQRTFALYNVDKPDEEKVLLCVGLGFGKLLHIGDADVFGSEVNAASKPGEDASKAREILVTDSMKERCHEISGIALTLSTRFLPKPGEHGKSVIP